VKNLHHFFLTSPYYPGSVEYFPIIEIFQYPSVERLVTRISAAKQKFEEEKSKEQAKEGKKTKSRRRKPATKRTLTKIKEIDRILCLQPDGQLPPLFFVPDVWLELF